MQITTKGQVTIPRQIRNRLSLLPHTKVEFALGGDHAAFARPGVRPAKASGDTWRWMSFAAPQTRA
jgi:bifunctional DNA-binding transcriptional regulator/antitoxin component of YhaV-PrlF toxin-antitoxin module